MSSEVQCYEIVDFSTGRVYLIPVINSNDVIYPLNQQESILTNNESEPQCSSSVQSDTQPDPAPQIKRSRTAFTNFQLEELEKEFNQQMYLTRMQRIDISNRLLLPEEKIKVWFQNRRMKNRRGYKKEVSTNVEQLSMEQYAQIGIFQPVLPSSDDSAMGADETHFNSTYLPQAYNIYGRVEAVPNVISDFYESDTLDLSKYLGYYAENAASGSQNTSTSFKLHPSSHTKNTAQESPDLMEILDKLWESFALSCENGYLPPLATTFPSYAAHNTVESIEYDLESFAEAFLQERTTIKTTKQASF